MYLLPLIVGTPIVIKSSIIISVLALLWEKFGLLMTVSLLLFILILFFGQMTGLLVLQLLGLPLLFVVDGLKHWES